MGARRILPEPAELERLRLTEQMSLQEIADKFCVSREAVRQSLRRAGIRSRPWTRYEEEVPWTIKPQHRNAHPLNLLRACARVDRGMPISEERRVEAQRWRRNLRRQGLVVGYGLHETAEGKRRFGFYYAQARAGVDKGLIREPKV
jgi:hypothetical protein